MAAAGKEFLPATQQVREWLDDAVRREDASTQFARFTHCRIPLACFLVPDKDGMTPLHAAAACHNLDKVAAKVREAGDRVTLDALLRPNGRGETALHVAAAGRDSLEQAVEVLEAAGETLRKEHLLVEDDNGVTPLQAASREGRLNFLLAVVRRSGERFGAGDWLARNRSGWSSLDAAGTRGILFQVFDPRDWRGRMGEMLELWGHVPEGARSQVDFERVSHEVALAGRRAPRVEPESFKAAARPEVGPPPGKAPETELRR
ncbi:MAG: ankyrin repeat domain-containing protein [Verrucomicrobium sp.]|nr:ankyrin repeat domain-containing protein [Verrucomicrobium sp.]